MELKKSPQADLNNKRSYFFQVGVIIALFMVVGLFSWSASEKKIDIIEQQVTAVEMEQVEVTVQEDKRPPAPLKTQAVVLSEMINVVKNDTKINQDLSILDLDMNMDLASDNTKYGGTYKGGESIVEEETPLVFAEEMPTFDGKDGQTEFSKWCQSNMRYPPLAADNGIQGRVTVSFVVEPNGKLSNIKLVRGVDKNLDQAALDIVARSPEKWKPARNNGRPVRLMIQMPIVFKLEQ